MVLSAHRHIPIFAALAFAQAFIACSGPQMIDEVGDPASQITDNVDHEASPDPADIGEPFAEEEGQVSGGSGGDDSVDEIPAPGFPAGSLRDLTYTIEGEPIALVDGERRMPYLPGAASENVHTLLEERVALGDLNGDGIEDAAAILINDPGGSGTFIYLAAVLAGPDGPENAATRLIGDRLDVQTSAISEGVIVLEVLAHGPEDPICCPTHGTVQTYRLEGVHLIGGPIEPEPKEGGAQPEG